MWLFGTQLIVACQAPPSSTISQNLLKFMSTELWCYLIISSSVLPSPFAFNLSQHQGLFQWVVSLYQAAKVIRASASESALPVNIQGWINWSDLPAVQGTLKSLLQHHNSKASILWRSALFMVQLSHPYMTTGKTTTLTIQTIVGKY